jgi:hypothetical protein
VDVASDRQQSMQQCVGWRHLVAGRDKAEIDQRNPTAHPALRAMLVPY